MIVKALTKRYQADIARVRKNITTRAGRVLHTRLMQPTDTPLLVEFYHNLSQATRARRFHQAYREVEPELVRTTARRLADVDNETHGGAVVALEKTATGERIVAVARLMRPVGEPTSPEAEAAITVRDDYHRQGVGTEMLRRLVLLARKMKVRTLVANIEADNYPALKLFRGLNLPTTSSTSQGESVLRIQMPE